MIHTQHDCPSQMNSNLSISVPKLTGYRSLICCCYSTSCRSFVRDNHAGWCIIMTKLNRATREVLNSTNVLWLIHEWGFYVRRIYTFCTCSDILQTAFWNAVSWKTIFHLHSILTEVCKGPIGKKSLSVQIMAWCNVTSHKTNSNARQFEMQILSGIYTFK